MENQIITDEYKEEMKKLQPQHSDYIVKNDYCSDELISILEDKNILKELECSYTFMRPPFVTHQVVMKWLREKGIYISVIVVYQPEKCYMWEISTETKFACGKKDSYEEAVEEALKYSLEKFNII